MRPFLAFVILMLVLPEAPVGASPRHDRAARAAWAWIAASQVEVPTPAPEPEPVAIACRCADGYQCECTSCSCPGCPSLRGWTWSDEEGGYWWKPKPVQTPATIPVYAPPIFQSAPQSFGGWSGGRSGGGRGCSGGG